MSPTSGFGDNVLVTGGNRGLGLGMVTTLAQSYGVKRVFAACRDITKADKIQPNVYLISIDVQDDKSIDAAFDEVQKILGNEPLNTLINNAGYGNREGISITNIPKRENYMKHLDINSIGPVIVTSKFLPLLLMADKNGERALLINISSTQGSLQKAIGAPEFHLAYAMSKSALNQFTRLVNKQFSDTGLITVSFCPGWVRTGMTGPEAQLSVDESITELLTTASKLTKDVEVEEDGMCMIDRIQDHSLNIDEKISMKFVDCKQKRNQQKE